MVSYLTRIFGMGRLDLAEDVVQDTLCRALETWPVEGLPENPSAWFMRVAGNRAIDLLRRDKQFRFFAPELTHLLKMREQQPEQMPAFEKEIKDDQLRMMFSCCHPGLSTEVQVTLILKTLCGFSVSEIAHALLAGEDSIEKRLGRARKLFRDSGEFVELSDPSDIPQRLEAVYQAIYLLFNEGYHGSRAEKTVRDDVCYEAVRLALLLSEHPQGARPKTYALVSLLCFHAARLPGRTDDEGGLVELEMQDRSKWDRRLVERGFQFLDRSASEEEMSEFHVEAAIASLHSGTDDYGKTDWRRIKDLYDLLYRLKPTPIVALNLAVAVGRTEGPERGLVELGKISDARKLDAYPFYAAAQGEFHRLAGRRQQARACFERALQLARNPSEARYLEGRVRSCADPV